MLRAVSGGSGGAASGITVGTSIITSGTNTRVLYDDSGVVGEAAGLTYTKASQSTAVVSGSFGLSGNISAAAWTTSGIRYRNTAATLTDTSSSGTVAAAYTDLWGGDTIAASSAATFTNYYGSYFTVPVAGTNVTLTSKWAIGADSIKITGAAVGSSVTTSGALNVLSGGAYFGQSVYINAGGLDVNAGVKINVNTTLAWTTNGGAGGYIFGGASTGSNTGTMRIVPNSGNAALNFGGDTSAAPAIVRNGTSLDFALADNSAKTFYHWAGQSRVSTQFDVTSNDVLANVTGLSVTVTAGKAYSFVATLYTTSNVAGGVKAAIAGTATATAIIYEGQTTAAAVIGAQTRSTALGTTVGAITAVTVARIDICGTITVNGGGTLTVQFAQNASSGSASSVLVGSTFIVQEF